MMIKRVISALIAVSALGTMLGTAMPASAAVHEHKIINAEGYGFADGTNVRISADHTVKGGSSWETVFYSDGTPCYSLEPGLSAKGSQIRRENYVYNDTTAYKLNLSEVQMDQLSQVLLYSYTEKPSDFNDFSEYMPKYIATQILVWEVVCGQRANDYRWSDDKWNMHRNFNYKSNGYTAVSELLNNFSDKQLGTEVRKYYDSYESAIRNNGKKITFAADKETKADTDSTDLIFYQNRFTMDSGEYTFYNFTNKLGEKNVLSLYADMNDQLDNFDVSVTDGEVVSRSAGTLTVKADASAEAEIKFTSRDSDKCGVMLIDGNNANEAAIVVPRDVKREYYTYVVGAENEESENILPGDVDLDGAVGIGDVIKLGKYNINPNLFPLGMGTSRSADQALKQADMNGDGKIDSLDISILMDHIMGKI